MSRAELHYALAIDAELHAASGMDPSLFDPIVRISGGLPGVARPFTVVRDYQGPQGYYAEHFVLEDPDGRERYRSQVRRIQLTGQMFSDRVESSVRELAFDTGDEHQLVFYIGDEELGRVPVFLETEAGGDPRVAAEETYKKAAGKGEICWLTVPQANGREHTQPVWFVNSGTTLYVLTGPSEQDVPGLTTTEHAEITLRSKDHRSLVSRVPAGVRVVPTGEDTYEKVIDDALSKRLNLKNLDEARQRWQEQCTLVELTPRFRDERAEAQPAAAAPTASSAQAPAAGQPQAAAPTEDDITVEAQIDQEVYDQLIAEGTSERVARGKAKAAYVRKEKERLRAEQASA